MCLPLSGRAKRDRTLLPLKLWVRGSSGYGFRLSIIVLLFCMGFLAFLSFLLVWTRCRSLVVALLALTNLETSTFVYLQASVWPSRWSGAQSRKCLWLFEQPFFTFSEPCQRNYDQTDKSVREYSQLNQCALHRLHRLDKDVGCRIAQCCCCVANARLFGYLS